MTLNISCPVWFRLVGWLREEHFIGVQYRRLSFSEWVFGLELLNEFVHLSSMGWSRASIDLGVEMPKAKSPQEIAGRNAVKTRYNKKQYVSMPLGHDDKKAIVELAQKPEQMLQLLESMVEAGYVPRFNYDAVAGVVGVNVDGDATAVNKGLVLESSGGTVSLTLASALHKVCVMCHYGAWRDGKDDTNWFS